MVQKSRHRIEKIEEALAAQREKRRKQLTKHFENSVALARHHATAVAAIVLGGQPKIDEPLGQAWARTLQHYDIGGNKKGQPDDQIVAARQLRPKIMGSEKESTRFTDIFRAAPVWLLQFTGMAWDANLLQFQLAEVSQNLSWGSAGYEEARQWPLLPSGILEAGDPIPPNDWRWIWIIGFCQITVPIPDEDMLVQADEENRSYRDDPILEGLSLFLDLESIPETELSRYEKRRLRKTCERIARSLG